ncbi:MAG: CHAT domain-containing protein [Desulfovibrio sp.]|jgi:tetratricopeptide (TPR) repeat protein|nr:CHAT domain-containing protein [Desulfovibrio sp.]
MRGDTKHGATSMRTFFCGLFLVCFCALLLTAGRVSAAGLQETFAQAQEAMKAGRFEEAATYFSQTADMLEKAKQPDKARAILANAGVCYIQAKKYEEAANVYEGVIAMKGAVDPETLRKYYNNLVVCRTNLGQNALRAQTLERMLKALPKLNDVEKADAYARMGDAYKALELYGKAQQSYKTAFDLLPPDARPEQRAMLLAGRGLCLGNLGDFNSAEQNLQMAKQQADALDIPLTKAESDSNLGILYWERGEYPKAMKFLKSALDIEEKNKLRQSEGRDYNNLGLVYKATGRAGEAMKHFEKSVAIAREVGDKRDEGIALMNCALLNRIGGNLNAARNDYRAALTFFEEIGYQRGKAGVLMGTARIAELEDRDLAAALKGYQEALDIYTKLELPFGQAEALNHIGDVLKQTVLPGRTTRDLVFDDEPTVPQMDKTEALKQCREAYSRALALAAALNSKELQWSALQGMGFVLSREGKLEDALAQYQKAIDIVANMRVSLESAELLGEFMAGKEDLFEEAMSLCGRLYDKSKNQKYLNLQMQYSETLRNEVQKASAALVQFNFDDEKKQAAYSQLMALGRQMAKAQAAVPVSAAMTKDVKAASAATPEQRAMAAEAKAEADRQKVSVQKLEQDYQKLLTEWKKQYPGDAVIFDSSSRVDIPSVQKALKDDQIALQYVSLTDKLMIMAIAKNKVDCVSVAIGRKELDTIIKKDFIVDNIEKYGHAQDIPTKEQENKFFENTISVLSRLYGILIIPVQNSLYNKKNIYIIGDGFLGTVPFSALVTSAENGTSNFLVEKYNIAYVRPSFITALTNPKIKKSTKTLLAVGNPRNEIIVTLDSLDGARREIESASAIIQQQLKDVSFENSATEAWFLKNLKNTSYEILYFATHGMPYSDVYYSYFLHKDKVKENKIPKFGKEAIEREFDFIEQHILTNSLLNSYLYMAKDNDGSDTGLLTMKKLMELPDLSFSNTRYAILSACNTGVTYVSKSLKKDITETTFTQSKEMENDLRKIGWIPGVDQVSFVDAFMRKGVNNVYGTLWFANDEASDFLMTSFIKNFIAQGDNQDFVAAFADAQRAWIFECKRGNHIFKSEELATALPLHPYYWAVGAIFGK